MTRIKTGNSITVSIEAQYDGTGKTVPAFVRLFLQEESDIYRKVCSRQ